MAGIIRAAQVAGKARWLPAPGAARPGDAGLTLAVPASAAHGAAEPALPPVMAPDLLAEAIAEYTARLQAAQHAWQEQAQQEQRAWLAEAAEQRDARLREDDERRAAWEAEAARAQQSALEAAAQQGEQAGVERARQAAHQEVQAQLERLRAAVGELARARGALEAAAEDDAVELAFAMLCRVLGERAATREGIAAMVQAQRAALRDGAQLQIGLHPADWRAMDGMDGANQAGIRYVADPDIALGGCRIDSAAGTLDARLEHQLEQLRAALLRARGEAA